MCGVGSLSCVCDKLSGASHTIITVQTYDCHTDA